MNSLVAFLSIIFGSFWLQKVTEVAGECNLMEVTGGIEQELVELKPKLKLRLKLKEAFVLWQKMR